MKKTSVFSFLSAAALAVPAALRAEAPAAPPPGPMGGGLMGLAPWILIFVVFYFLLIRPQQKQAAEQRKMIDGLKKGDRVLTQGGLYGTVAAVKGAVLELKLNEEGVKVLVSKSSVAQLVAGDPAEPETPAKAG